MSVVLPIASFAATNPPAMTFKKVVFAFAALWFAPMNQAAFAAPEPGKSSETASASPQEAAVGKVNPLIASDAKVEKLADGFTFLEGPAAAANGDLYFVDMRKNKILH